jgi:hypothetical protein
MGGHSWCTQEAEVMTVDTPLETRIEITEIATGIDIQTGMKRRSIEGETGTVPRKVWTGRDISRKFYDRQGVCFGSIGATLLWSQRGHDRCIDHDRSLSGY